jgi:protein-S-isoprenylcysteine O-methyltransferase Ste14
MMRVLSGITMVSWWLFMLVWAVKYRGNKQSVLVQSKRERRAYTIPLLLGVILMSGFPAFLWPSLHVLTTPLLSRSLVTFGASAAVSVLGVALAIWARFTLGRDWSAEVTLKRDHALVTRGPYATIRHPIYTALILLFAGLVLIFGTPGAVLGLALIIWSCWVKLRQEEALMLGQFPQSYPAYMVRTKRLVPFLV